MSDAATQFVVAIVPARYESSRFPGKPLADETGKPLIQHVVEQVDRAQRIGAVLVATDDARIAEAVHQFGGQAVMTRADHPNGTCRIAEVIEQWPTLGLEHEPELIINVQGDEPEIEPGVIDALAEAMLLDPDAPMGTLGSPFADDEDPANPNIVKLILNQRGDAMYFSRSLIPHDRDRSGATFLKHPGLYAYRPDFLRRYTTLTPTPLEQTEKLEQLRVLEHGHRIKVVQCVTHHHGIDTPEQYAAFVKRQAR